MNHYLKFIITIFITIYPIIINCLGETIDLLNNNQIPEFINNHSFYSSNMLLKNNRKKLLIMFIDGVRYDYIDRDPTLKGFPRIAKNGVHAEYVVPIYPSNTYPNSYAILTGLHSESHGMVQNIMYDGEYDDYFLMDPHPNATLDHWWNDAEPIWTVAEKNGIPTASYLWMGNQAEINGIRLSYYEGYRSLYDCELVDRETRRMLKKVIKDFKNNKYGLALVYYEYVDHIGHVCGPESESLKNAVKYIDYIVYDLQDSIIRHGLSDDLNVVLVSDHGMVDISETPIIRLEDYVDFNYISLCLDWGAYIMIQPTHGAHDTVFRQLSNKKGFTVYRKADIPERYHVKNHRLVLPMVLIVDPGYHIIAPQINGKVYPLTIPVYNGIHGYDPEILFKMRAFMYAFGPSFKNNYTGRPLKQVDHFNLFCHLLNITPPPNNGSWERVKDYLKV